MRKDDDDAEPEESTGRFARYRYRPHTLVGVV